MAIDGIVWQFNYSEEKCFNFSRSCLPMDHITWCGGYGDDKWRTEFEETIWRIMFWGGIAWYRSTFSFRALVISFRIRLFGQIKSFAQCQFPFMFDSKLKIRTMTSTYISATLTFIIHIQRRLHSILFRCCPMVGNKCHFLRGDA